MSTFGDWGLGVPDCLASLVSSLSGLSLLAQAFLNNNNLQPQNKGSRRSQSYHEISIVSIDYDEPSNVSCFTW